MFEEAIQNIETEIKKHIQMKFGLSDEQTKSSGDVLKEHFKKISSGNGLKENIDHLKNIISGNVDKLNPNQLLEKFDAASLVNELKEKAGINEETAQKIKDFSFESFTNKVKSEFTNEDGNLEVKNIIEKLKNNSLEDSKDFFNKLKDKLS